MTNNTFDELSPPQSPVSHNMATRDTHEDHKRKRNYDIDDLFTMDEGDEDNYSSSSMNEMKFTKSSQSKKRKMRFSWTDEMHNKFVAALFDVGLQSATPKFMHQLMEPYVEEGITTDHIKSHLQKYRAFYDKYRRETVGHFADALNKANIHEKKPKDSSWRKNIPTNASLLSSTNTSSSNNHRSTSDFFQIKTEEHLLPSSYAPDTLLSTLSTPHIGALSISSSSINSASSSENKLSILLTEQQQLLNHQQNIMKQQLALQEEMNRITKLQESLNLKLLEENKSMLTFAPIDIDNLDFLLE